MVFINRPDNKHLALHERYTRAKAAEIMAKDKKIHAMQKDSCIVIRGALHLDLKRIKKSECFFQKPQRSPKSCGFLFLNFMPFSLCQAGFDLLFVMVKTKNAASPTLRSVVADKVTSCKACNL